MKERSGSRLSHKEDGRKWLAFQTEDWREESCEGGGCWQEELKVSSRGPKKSKWGIQTEVQACRRQNVVKHALQMKFSAQLMLHYPYFCRDSYTSDTHTWPVLGSQLDEPDGRRVALHCCARCSSLRPGVDHWEQSRDGRCWQSSTWRDFITPKSCRSPAARRAA